MNTESSQKISSKTYPASISLQILEIVLLTLIGAVGVLLHAKFRAGIGVPGHWGLVYMAILISGRMFSKKSYASSLSSIGAVSMLMFPLGYKDPFMPVLYIFPGLILDAFFFIVKNRKSALFIWALISGLAYMSLPAARIIISLTIGYTHTSLIAGFFYPILTHFIFGAIGGLIALGLYKIIKKTP